MKPNKEAVEYLYECRCCRRRKNSAQRIHTTYKRSADQIIDQFSHIHLELCNNCGNLAVHDLIALSPEAEVPTCDEDSPSATV